MTLVTTNKLTTKHKKWNPNTVQVVFSNIDIYSYSRILRETAQLLVEHARLAKNNTQEEEKVNANHAEC